MFERFTDRARKVMALSNMEAQRLGAEYIGTEHILLGLVKEGSGTGAAILKNLGVDLRRVRQEVERRVKTDSAGATGKLPQTDLAKRVLQNSISEARGLDHRYVGTEHMLLGLVLDEGVAGATLRDLGVTIEGARKELLSVLKGSAGLAGAASPGGPSSGLRDIARALRTLADRLEVEAQKNEERQGPRGQGA